MLVSMKWLRQYVDLDGISDTQVATTLTFAGIEVESVRPLTISSLITTGKVLSKNRVEGSQHLSALTVDTGAHGHRSIVCGAANVAVGQIVLVALPGAQLKDIKIQESSIRGVVSQGMVCSLLELGIEAKYLRQEQVDGIEVLASDTAIGDDQILDKLGYNDTILELKLLANRPDLLSLYHVALEVGALFDRAVKPWTMPSNFITAPANFTVDIQSDKVKQFSIKVVEGINKVNAPQWLKVALIASGIRPISLLVDIGNYVMVLTGQPLHMYDLDKLASPSLTIREGQTETITALDGKSYPTLTSDIRIDSGNQFACLAGVMGAHATQIDETTKSVAIEAAAFDGPSIRRTAQRLNLISESSQRFAKGMDFSSSEKVLDFAVSLLASMTTFKSVQQTVHGRTTPSTELKKIKFDVTKINRLLGTTWSCQRMETTLKRLGMIVRGDEVTIPPFRVDMHTVADLAEEIVRLEGFDQLPETGLPHHDGRRGLNEKQTKVRALKNVFKARGYDEILTYSLQSTKQFQSLPSQFEGQPYYVHNPLSEERQVMRTSLLPSLIETIGYNIDRQNLQGQVFEMSQVTSTQAQSLHLAIGLWGNRFRRDVYEPIATDFYTLKGMIEAALQILHIEPTRYQWVKTTQQDPLFHPGQSAVLMLGSSRIGVIGAVSPTQLQLLGFGQIPLFVAELNLDPLLQLKTGSLKLTPLGRFPVVTRDLAFIVKNDVSFQNIVKTIKKAGKKLVDDVLLLDRYIGANLLEGTHSLAVRIRLESHEKTLTEEEILLTMMAVQTALVQEHHVILRISA